MDTFATEINNQPTNISIIIPFFNQIQLTKDCIRSIYKHTLNYNPRFQYEIILVDDASSEKYFIEAEYSGYNLKIIQNPFNVGFAISCNRGAAAAKSDYLIFLNNDTTATNGWIEGLLDIIESNSEIGIVGSKLLYPDESIQHAGVAIDDERMPFHIYHRFPADFPGVNKLREYQAVTGACFIIKRELFQTIGGFDERYKNGFEDIDLCFRVKQAGYKIFYSPQSCLVHLESKTLRYGPSYYVENLALFKEKWAGKVFADYLNFFETDLSKEAELPFQFQRLKKLFQYKEKLQLVIWGAGGSGRHMAVMLRLIGIIPDYFVDSNSEKWGTVLEEVKICSPDYLKEMKGRGQPIFVIIASLYYQEIQTNLYNFGFEPGKQFW